MSPKEKQAREALAEANRIRQHRATISNIIGKLTRPAGLVETAKLIRSCDPEWETCPVNRILKTPHGNGPQRVKQICRTAGIPETKKLGKLTVRQRDVLAGALTLMAGREHK